MKAPLEEDEEEGEKGAPAEEQPLRPKDKYIDLDGEFRGDKCSGRPKSWKEIIKIANEVLLDEMKVLLECAS